MKVPFATNLIPLSEKRQQILLAINILVLQFRVPVTPGQQTVTELKPISKHAQITTIFECHSA